MLNRRHATVMLMLLNTRLAPGFGDLRARRREERRIVVVLMLRRDAGRVHFLLFAPLLVHIYLRRRARRDRGTRAGQRLPGMDILRNCASRFLAEARDAIVVDSQICQLNPRF